MNKNILIHVKNNELLNEYVKMLRENCYDNSIHYSKEVRFMIEEFSNNNWNVYLTSIDNFSESTSEWTRIYDFTNDKIIDLTIFDINNLIDVMIIRNIGSVELNFDIISNYLTFLVKNFTGKILNNPFAMKKGMTKNYLVEIDPTALKNIGMLTIPTVAYDKTITLEQIHKDFSDLSNYLIKPITGELSNSLSCLANIDDNFLRHKENKVGGWIVQPIKNEIWNGEYQQCFIGNELVHAQEKTYNNNRTSYTFTKNEKH